MIRRPELPCLPGYSINSKVGQTKFHKSHHFDILDRQIPFLAEKSLPGIGGEPLSWAKADRFPSVYPRCEGAELPSWLLYDKQTLAFEAYYLENVYEGGLYQNFVVHKCKICYFLEDGTLQVFEKPVVNSGLSQGCLVKRQKVRIPGRGDTDFYGLLDLNVGREIELFGKVFKITNCDTFTRRFLNRLGISVPEAIEGPGDPYLQLRSIEGRKQKRQVVKDYTIKKMLEMDNRILTFDAYWDDSGDGYGFVHRLKILYYLIDDTMEVKDVTDKDKTFTLVRRSKFPKEMELTLTGPGATEEVSLLNVLGPSVERSRSLVDPLGIGVERKEYYSDKDLTVGSVLGSYGRRFVIVDMDPFTKEYYHQRYGLQDIHPLPVPLSQEELSKVTHKARPKTPPYNGFGSYEDSLHNVKYLDPASKVMVKKVDPLREPFGYDKKILRFLAVLLEDEKVVRDRKFIISYFLLDDTISVYEIAFVNSGRDGGTIIGRRKIYAPGANIYTSRPQEIGLGEFFLGNTLTLEEFVFRLVDVDEYTMKYMESHPSEFPKNNVRTILSKIREKVKPNFKNWAAPIITENRPLSFDRYRDWMKSSFGNDLTEHEILALARHFSERKVTEKWDREKIRTRTHNDLRRFLFEDFDRVKENLKHFDSLKTGFVTSKEAYTILRGAQLPLPVDLIHDIIDMFTDGSPLENRVEYEKLIDFLDYKKYASSRMKKTAYKTTAMDEPPQDSSMARDQVTYVNGKAIVDALQLEEDLMKENK